MKSARTLACWLIPIGLLSACGGRSEEHDSSGTGGSAAATGGNSGTSAGGSSGSHTGGDAGNTTGGTGAVGGNDGGSAAITGGSSGTAGDAGTSGAGGTQTCCTAAPICPSGYEEVPIEQGCPTDVPCQTVTVCCSTILCAAMPSQCHSVPTCDAGDKQATGECPPDSRCYSRSQCGSTITCIDLYCDPTTDYNDHYIGTGNCEAIDFDCPANTTPFFNDCGCGCRQSDMCPPYVDCEPSPDPKPNCTDAFQRTCPYTARAL